MITPNHSSALTRSRTAVAVAVAVMFASSAAAQDPPVSLGAGYLLSAPVDGALANGAVIDFGVRLKSQLVLNFEASAVFRTTPISRIFVRRTEHYSAVAGPQIHGSTAARTRPFGRLMAGAVWERESSQGLSNAQPNERSTRPTLIVDGGIQRRIVADVHFVLGGGYSLLAGKKIDHRVRFFATVAVLP